MIIIIHQIKREKTQKNQFVLVTFDKTLFQIVYTSRT